MLSQLYIKNVAVISEATIDFSQGLNVFTGETGAGKTILISAINAVLGERASKDMIRTGESHAVISALFKMCIRDRLQAAVVDAMRYSLLDAGKRLRAALVLEFARLASAPREGCLLYTSRCV